MSDEHHDNTYEDTGELASSVADRAYPDWRDVCDPITLDAQAFGVCMAEHARR